MNISPISTNYKPNFSGMFKVNNDHINDNDSSSVVDKVCDEFISKHPDKSYRYNHVNESYITCIPALEPELAEELIKNQVSFIYKGDSDIESNNFF